jgi:hypothetical protein
MRSKKPHVILILLIVGSLTAGTGLPVHAQAMNFGYASVGDSPVSTFGGVFVSNFTSPPNIGAITQIRAYLATGGASAQAVLYADDNGAPYALLANSSVINVEASNGTWVTFDLSYTGAPNTVYWLGIVLDSAATYYVSTRATEQAVYQAPLPSTLDPIPSGNITKGIELSIAAVYTPVQNPEPSEETPSIVTCLEWIAVAGLIVAALLTVAVLVQRRNKQKH